MNERRPSISDVAALAGVSRSSVSFALNGRRKVSEATRLRIVAAAEALGYMPNHAARWLKTGKSRIIGFQVSGVEPGILMPTSALATYFAEVMNGASTEARMHGWFVIVAPNTAGSTELLGLPLDGGIVLDPVGGESLAEAMHATARPLVTIGRPPTEDRQPHLVVDARYDLLMNKALDHILEAGYRRPAAVMIEDRASYVNDLAVSFETWCSAHDMAPLWARPSHADFASARQATARLLARPDGPDCFVAIGDQLGLGALQAAHDVGRNCPNDVGVVALTSGGRSFPLELAHPDLTIIDLHAATIGRNAVRELLSLLDYRHDSKVDHLDITIKQGGSTRRPRPAD